MKEKHLKLLEVLIGAIPLIAGSMTIYKNLYSNNGNTFTYSIAFTLILITILVYHYIRFQRILKRKLSICNESVHLLNHKLRDEFYSLRSLEYQKKLTDEFLMINLSSTCNNLVNQLSKALTEITGRKVCVHIKHFPPEDNKDLRRNEGIVKTLCNCNETMQLGDRHKIGSHKISDNTHYEMLLDNENGHLYFPDFHKYKNRYDKTNSNKQFKLFHNTSWKKHYKSMVLVAIQLKKRTINYDVLGILIADSPKRNTFKPKDEVIITSLMKAYADGLYTYFDRVKFLQKKSIK